MAPEKPKKLTSKSSIVGVEFLKDDIGPIVRDERQTFLYCAAEHPKIRLAESLRSNIYSKVLALPPSFWEDQFSPASIAHHRELLQQMRLWAENFNLCVEWVILEAWQAINHWQIYPEISNPFIWRNVYVSPPSFYVPVWFPENAEWYRGQVLQAFTDVLDRYIADSEKSHRSYNPPATRERKVPVEDRYTWAALRVCCAWSSERIARSIEHRVTTRRIENAVREVCERIGLSIPNVRPAKK